jgi:hypothetical protein
MCSREPLGGNQKQIPAVVQHFLLKKKNKLLDFVRRVSRWFRAGSLISNVKAQWWPLNAQNGSSRQNQPARNLLTATSQMETAEKFDNLIVLLPQDTPHQVSPFIGHQSGCKVSTTCTQLTRQLTRQPTDNQQSIQ